MNGWIFASFIWLAVVVIDTVQNRPDDARVALLIAMGALMTSAIIKAIEKRK